jgi:hypothetical protein
VGRIRDQLFMANEVILQLDIAQEFRQLAMPKLALRRDERSACWGPVSLDRTIAKQRARVATLKDNDVSS